MQNLKIYFFLIIAALSFIACQDTSVNIQTQLLTESSKEQTKIAAIEKLIKTKMEANNIPALSVGLIKNNQIYAFINSGTLERGSTIPIDENTIFQLGSLSKSFTGILANHLIEQKQLNTQTSITDYLPNSLNETTLKKLRPITVQHLLQHQSGLPRDAASANRPFKFIDGPMVGGYDEVKLLNDLAALELLFEPGSQWSYSNLGYGLLGYICEKVSGQSLKNLFDTYFKVGYNMERTTIDLAKAKTIGIGMPTPYKPSMRRFETAAWEMGYLRTGGGVCSTVADLSKLMLRQMQDYQNYNKNQSTTPLILTKEKVSWVGNSGYPYYGYGCFQFRETNDTTIVQYGHGGDVDGFASAYIFYPNQGVGYVMLTSSGGEWFYKELEWHLRKLLLDTPPRQTIATQSEQLAKLSGTYEFSKGQAFKITSEEDYLLVEMPNVGSKKAYACALNHFFVEDFPTELFFEGQQLHYIDNFGNRHLGLKKAEISSL